MGYITGNMDYITRLDTRGTEVKQGFPTLS